MNGVVTEAGPYVIAVGSAAISIIVGRLTLIGNRNLKHYERKMDIYPMMTERLQELNDFDSAEVAEFTDEALISPRAFGALSRKDEQWRSRSHKVRECVSPYHKVQIISGPTSKLPKLIERRLRITPRESALAMVKLERSREAGEVTDFRYNMELEYIQFGNARLLEDINAEMHYDLTAPLQLRRTGRIRIAHLLRMPGEVIWRLTAPRRLRNIERDFPTVRNPSPPSNNPNSNGSNFH